MSDEIGQQVGVRISAMEDFGPGNIGEFGPTQTEAEAIEGVRDEKYWGPISDESGCMDDRLEGLRVRLAGNRAVSEVAASYMDRHTEAEPQSRVFARKVHELITMGRPPVFHEGCAALASQREALHYAADNVEAVIESAWSTLDELGATEFLTKELLAANIRAGKNRAEDDKLWDVSAEEILEIARRAGARVEQTPGNHKVAANLKNMTPYGFDNGAYRRDNPGEDGLPMGMLETTWVAYRDQLLEDGYREDDVAHILMRCVIFNVAVQKMINKDGSPVVTVEANN